MLRRQFLSTSFSTATLVLAARKAIAQGRLSDNDLAKLMNNLKDDSKQFSNYFKQDLSKSSIRKTSDEKSAKQAADRFSKEVEGMMKQFKSKKNADAAIPAVYQTYTQLGQYMTKISPGANTSNSWAKVQAGMNQVTQALHFTPPA